GSKNGTTRKGCLLVISSACFIASPEIILGSDDRTVSTKKSVFSKRAVLCLSSTLQSTKKDCLTRKANSVSLFNTPRLFTSCLRMRSCNSQRGMSKYTRRSLLSQQKLAPGPSITVMSLFPFPVFSRSFRQLSGSKKSLRARSVIYPKTRSSVTYGYTIFSISGAGFIASVLSYIVQEPNTCSRAVLTSAVSTPW